ncbi:MAG: PilW family protein, partial [Candidatus Paceibacteria bacterium]
MPQKFSKNLGFTLPEMLVAFLLFSIIMGTTTGIFVSGFRSWRRVSSFLNVQNNVRFAIESISRELRTGADYQILRGGGSSMTSGMGMGENGDV